MSLLSFFHPGIIRVKNKLDREAHTDLTFIVIATDNGVPAMSSLATVYVRLLDVNDNNPKFPAHPSLYHVSEDAAIGHVVTTITGTDADVGHFGALFYTLSGVDNDGTFSIIEDTVSNKQPWPCTCLTKQWSSSVISIEFYAQQKPSL